MNGGDTAGQISEFNLAESGVLNRSGKTALAGKAPDALRKIAICRAVASDHFAQTRQNGKRIKIVNCIQSRHRDFGKFQAKKPAAGLQHAKGFLKHPVEMSGVANAKCNGIDVLARSRDGKPFRIAADPMQVFRTRASEPLLKHRKTDVANRDRRVATPASHPAVNPGGDVSGTARHVEQAHARPWIKPGDEIVLPQPVYP